jgi:NAD(P)H-hydrate epimerase
MSHPMPAAAPPFVTTAQMIEVDRAMIEDYGITLLQMMENAGLALARLARSRFLDDDARGRGVVVLAGSGGNGGGALVAARRLAAWGATVHIAVTVEDAAFGPVPARQLAIVRRMGLPILHAAALGDVTAELIVDGVIGYRLTGAPAGGAADLIRWANAYPAPVLALDVPSGVDADTGTVFAPAVLAAATMTLALPKRGLAAPAAAACVGELYLADIGVPPALYAAAPLHLDVGPVFSQAEIVRIR